MTDEQLIEALARLLTRAEDRTTTDLRATLLQLALRIRALLLTLPPEGNVTRTILYSNLRPRLLVLLQDFTTVYYASLRLTLPELSTTLDRLIARYLNVTPTSPRPLQDLLTTATVLTRTAADLFTPAPNGISPFTLQLERLLNTSVRGAIFRNVPTPAIADLITPQTRRIRPSTVANAWLDRTSATTAALLWSLVVPAMQATASASELPAPTSWRWNAILDPRTCPVCRPLDGLVVETLEDFPLGPPPLHPRCVTGDSRVTTGTVLAAYRARYRGDIVTLTTEDSRRISVTSKHPMLTTRGWVRAGALRNGDYLISDLLGIPTGHADAPNLDQLPPRAEDVFNTLLAASPVPAVTMPSAPVQFHGDGDSMDGQVEIVLAFRELQQHLLVTPNFQQSLNHLLIAGRPGLIDKSPLCAEDKLFFALNSAACGSVSLFEQSKALLSGHLSLPQQHRFTASAWSHPEFLEPSIDYVPAAAELVGQCLDTGTFPVETQKLVGVEIESVGHGDLYVYDFATLSGIYSIEHLLSHNCRCIVIPSFTDDIA